MQKSREWNLLFEPTYEAFRRIAIIVVLKPNRDQFLALPFLLLIDFRTRRQRGSCVPLSAPPLNCVVVILIGGEHQLRKLLFLYLHSCNNMIMPISSSEKYWKEKYLIANTRKLRSRWAFLRVELKMRVVYESDSCASHVTFGGRFTWQLGGVRCAQTLIE